MNTIAPPTSIHDQKSTADLFRKGFLAMLPLWAAAIPFGIAYGIAAREAGFSAQATQLMSLSVFSAAAQVSAISLLQAGSTTLEILVTAGALNIHLLLIGAVIARELNLPPLHRLGTSFLLTDAAYAIAASKAPLRTPVLLGAGVCMYFGWNAGTAMGLIAGAAIPNPQQFAVDFIIPLTFLAVVIPMLRNWPTMAVAAGAAGGTVLLSTWLPAGFAILGTGIAASVLGGRLTRPVGGVS